MRSGQGNRRVGVKSEVKRLMRALCSGRIQEAVWYPQIKKTFRGISTELSVGLNRDTSFVHVKARSHFHEH